MAQAYTLIRGLGEFAAAREQFNYLVDRLQSEEMAGMEHGEIEELIRADGMELLRRLLQGHLNLRAAREVKRSGVEGTDGVIRPHCRKACRRNLMSVFGLVEVQRLGYGVRGGSSLFPLDGELNLPEDKYSHGLRRRVAEEVARNSFDEVVVSVVKTTGGKVPKRQAEGLAAEIAQDFEAFYEGRGATLPEQTRDPLVMSLDGKGIVMRQDSLREATRKAAAGECHKLKTRLSRGEKRNRKRMATVATVYSIEGQVRNAEAIMGLKEADDPHKPRARNKRVWASVKRAPRAVTDEVFQEALRRDPAKERPWAMLVDGGVQQLKDIKTCIEYHQVAVTLILDFIHVLEYLWKAAFCFHAEGSEEAEAWVAERALQILQGKVSDVAAGIRRSATLRQLSTEERKPVDTCTDYLLKYQQMLKYDEYLAAGLPIATGVIEGACRHLIKDRMDITGARWGLQSAEAILKLRSLHSSGDLDEYWNFYKSQTLKRNRASRYNDFPLQEAA